MSRPPSARTTHDPPLFSSEVALAVAAELLDVALPLTKLSELVEVEVRVSTTLLAEGAELAGAEDEVGRTMADVAEVVVGAAEVVVVVVVELLATTVGEVAATSAAEVVATEGVTAAEVSGCSATVAAVGVVAALVVWSPAAVTAATLLIE